VHSSLTSITRHVRPASVANLARATTAIEGGFIAAGVTVSVIAVVGSLTTMLNWIFFG
jgi:hypothetical protein